MKKLSSDVQQRIAIKLSLLIDHEDIFAILKPLVVMAPATHRLRVGSYRLILQCRSNSKNAEFVILEIAHRRNVYR